MCFKFMNSLYIIVFGQRRDEINLFTISIFIVSTANYVLIVAPSPIVL